MAPAVTVLVILAVSVVVFVSNRVQPAVVAVLTAASLFLTGVLPFEATVAGLAIP